MPQMLGVCGRVLEFSHETVVAEMHEESYERHLIRFSIAEMLIHLKNFLKNLQCFPVHLIKPKLEKLRKVIIFKKSLNSL